MGALTGQQRPVMQAALHSWLKGPDCGLLDMCMGQPGAILLGRPMALLVQPGLGPDLARMRSCQPRFPAAWHLGFRI
jgi:hypothetical protein